MAEKARSVCRIKHLFFSQFFPLNVCCTWRLDSEIAGPWHDPPQLSSYGCFYNRKAPKWVAARRKNSLCLLAIICCTGYIQYTSSEDLSALQTLIKLCTAVMIPECHYHTQGIEERKVLKQNMRKQALERKMILVPFQISTHTFQDIACNK